MINNKATARPTTKETLSREEYLVTRIKVVEESLQYAPPYEIDKVWVELNDLSIELNKLKSK